LIDTWLATGPSTRRKIRRFILWAVHTKRIGAIDVPDRRPNPRPTLKDTERIDLLGALLQDDHPAPPAYRLAGVLVLLYGIPFTRMRRLTLDDVLVDSDGHTYLNLGDSPAVVPPRVAALIHAHLADRPNLNTAYSTSPWVFPGLRPGEARTAPPSGTPPASSASTSTAAATPPSAASSSTSRRQ
jgi:integrase